jgi:hypothetical protein
VIRVYKIETVERKAGKTVKVTVKVEDSQLWDYILDSGQLVRSGWGSIYPVEYIGEGAIKLGKSEFNRMKKQLYAIFSS